MANPHDDDVEVLPIQLDGETVQLLARFARACGKHPIAVAADLLRDVLRDDADAHQLLN